MNSRSFAVASLVLAVLVGAVALVGCNSPTEATSGRLSMTSKYTAAALSAQPMKAGVSATAAVVDSLHITRARLVLSRIKFEKGSGDSAEFRTAPFVFEPNLGGTVQQVYLAGLPFGTYDKVKFKIHHIDSSDLRGVPPSELDQFADFLQGERYSMIIDGIVYRPGMGPEAFTFRSKVDAEQNYSIAPPLVVSESQPEINVTFAVSSFDWFKDTDGSLLDPTDPSNESRIDEGLKSSVKVYKDANKDGEADDN